ARGLTRTLWTPFPRHSVGERSAGKGLFSVCVHHSLNFDMFFCDWIKIFHPSLGGASPLFSEKGIGFH
ncbi:MAG: hypothetical protein ACI4LE_03710, partial [Faecalibacterium sp.]